MPDQSFVNAHQWQRAIEGLDICLGNCCAAPPVHALLDHELQGVSHAHALSAPLGVEEATIRSWKLLAERAQRYCQRAIDDLQQGGQRKDGPQAHRRPFAARLALQEASDGEQLHCRGARCQLVEAQSGCVRRGLQPEPYDGDGDAVVIKLPGPPNHAARLKP
eukprot:2990195-Alexandrium_andersonii.AAC.1